MQTREFIERFFAVLQQADFDPSPVFGGTTAFDETQLLATRDQRDYAVLLGLQALGKLTDGCPVATGVALDMQQQQILQRRHPILACHLLAEADKLPYLVAKIRQCFEVVFIQGQVVEVRHGGQPYYRYLIAAE